MYWVAVKVAVAVVAIIMLAIVVITRSFSSKQIDGFWDNIIPFQKF
jgi:hypothetical protein